MMSRSQFFSSCSGIPSGPLLFPCFKDLLTLTYSASVNGTSLISRLEKKAGMTSLSSTSVDGGLSSRF